jgi:hypothetical protein
MEYLVLAASLVLYMLPGLIAYRRKHRSKLAIAVLNLLTGWTLLGYLISLIWSLTGNVEPGMRKVMPTANS